MSSSYKNSSYCPIGAGPYTVEENTPSAGFTTITDSGGDSFVISSSGGGTVGLHTTITSIDLAATGNPNEFIVTLTWVDENGVTQTTTDTTPVTLIPDSLCDADSDTCVFTVEGGATVGAGDRLDFTVDGVVQMSLQAGKLSLNGLVVDPARAFEFEPRTQAQVQADCATYGMTFENTIWVDSVTGHAFRGFIDLELLGTVAVSNTVAAGNEIATLDDGTGPVPIYETITALVDNGDGTFTYTSENGTATTITSAKSIVTQVVTGQEIASHDDGLGVVTSIQETVTTLVDNGDNTFTYISEDGTAITFSPATDVLVDNGNGTFTHTAVDGTAVVIDFNNSVVTQTVTVGNEIAVHDDGNGILTSILETITGLGYDPVSTLLTYTKEDGTQNIISLADLTTDIYVDGGTFVAPILTLTDNDGTTPDVTIDLSALQSIVNQVVTGQTIATHDNGSGTTINIQESITTLVDNGDGTFTYTSENGTATNIVSAQSVVTQTVLAGNQIATHSDGINAAIPVFETVTTLVDNGDGTFTYTSENGTAITFSPATDVLVDNGDGTFTHTAVDGTAVTIDFNNSVVTPIVTGQTIATHDPGDGVLVNIQETITALVDNGDGTFTHTSEDGTVTTYTSPVSTYVDTNPPATPAAHSWTHTSGDGTVVTSNEALTSLALGADGCSLDYTDEDDTTSNVLLPRSVFTYDTATCLITHDDGCGNVVTIDNRSPVTFQGGMVCNLIVQTGATLIYTSPCAVTITGANYSLGTAPDANVTVDTLVNGASVGTTTIPAGSATGIITGGAGTVLAAGDSVAFQVTGVDGGTAENLMMQYSGLACCA